MFEKMRGLSTRQKMEYYLEYYGLSTLVVIAGVTLIIFLTVHFLTNKQLVSGVLAVNADGEEIRAVDSEYFNDFLKENGVDPKKNAILINCSLRVAPNYEDEVVRGNMQTIQTMFITHTIDIFFADEEYFVSVAESDYLADLRDYIPKEVLETHKEDLVYAENFATQEKILAGIRVQPDTLWMKGTGWYQSEAVVGLTSEMKNEQLAVQMLLCAIGEAET